MRLGHIREMLHMLTMFFNDAIQMSDLLIFLHNQLIQLADAHVQVGNRIL